VHNSSLSYFADNYDKMFYINLCLDLKKQRDSAVCLENNMFVRYFFELIVGNWRMEE
jgi:hypothetical protein